MSFSNMIQDALSGHGHSNNNNNRHDNDNDDFNPAVRYAESHTNTSDPSLFTSALSFLNENKHRLSNDNDINEQEMIHAHQSLYGGGESERRHDSSSVGAGAAMQALKMFTSSSEGEKSGMDKNAFIGLAMAQAKKMFEEKEAKGEVNGDKQSAINAAAEMALKMYLKSGGGGMAGTGGPGGGLLQLASKFL
ncbi:uncharacterized protein NFIA_098410 [Aspergillus fischeri NRRL 181]|uniref:DUF7721 domain-containing protein n=1 Tax=Neosartorya fischeri (strain ATCC 1020 / DSM 3700 / CBS 544.65 / FGSC A1164 / JCM 1740 / NRRL 181 / WB 181) TaxID=331117 RepID=A1DBH1_NEOFI|nr:uncharacterized protein NFIA_098410 [Aspergillus fischeri NRRL 181]EAW20211.1 predicted protein [Aspergillus fischeri NRRL 181]KAG2006418.1 hypothetical protein GB937_008706 [Aspergillus fischeri]